MLDQPITPLSERSKRPIVICGFPRTGTTFLRELLNSHPDIHISIECRMRALFAVPLLCAQTGLLHRREHERWRGLTSDEARIAMLKAVWYYSEPEGLLVRRYGNKTPGNEHRFWLHESIFRPLAPLYIYAIREPKAAIESYLRMPWGAGKSRWALAIQLHNSIGAMRRFQNKHPERLLEIAVDRVETDEHRRDLVERVFRFIGEEPTPEVWDFVDRWPLVNPSRNRDAAPADASRWSPHGVVRRLQRELGYAPLR